MSPTNQAEKTCLIVQVPKGAPTDFSIQFALVRQQPAARRFRTYSSRLMRGTIPPPTPQLQPFSVGVFSCQTARNPANRLEFLRTLADLPSRPPTPPLGLLHSLLALLISNPGLPPGPEVRSRENFCCSESACYTRTDRCGCFVALGGGGEWASSRGAAPE
jgi:hypothetical protein